MGRHKPNKPRAKARSREVAAGILSAMADLDLPGMDDLEKFGLRCMSNNYIGVIYGMPGGLKLCKAFGSWADTCAYFRSKPAPPPGLSVLLLLPDVCGVEAVLAGADVEVSRPVSVLGGRTFQMARVPRAMFGP